MKKLISPLWTATTALALLTACSETTTPVSLQPIDIALSSEFANRLFIRRIASPTAVALLAAHVLLRLFDGIVKRLINKEIHVVEYSDQPDKFVANVFRNYDVKSVQLEQRGDITHATVTVEATKKGRAIGKEGRNLRVSRDLIARHHSIQSVSVA